MTTPIPASEYERRDPRIIIIGGKELAQYIMAVGMRFQYHDEIILQHMPYNAATVIRVLDFYKQFGVAEKRGSRKEVMVKDKNGNPITVRETVIKKPGMLLP